MSSNQRRTTATTPSPSSQPIARPLAEATTPSASASSRTARRSWRRVTPTQRRSAKSRIRWAKRIANVLAMTSAPTNSAMATKSSAMIAMMSTPREISACWAATQAADVSTVASGARSRANAAEPPHATASTQSVSSKRSSVLHGT
jgi:hypothetical protein